MQPWTQSTPAYFYTNNSTAIKQGEHGQTQCCSVLVLRDPCDGNGMFVRGAEVRIPEWCFEDDHLLLQYDTSIRQFIIKTSDEGAAAAAPVAEAEAAEAAEAEAGAAEEEPASPTTASHSHSRSGERRWRE